MCICKIKIVIVIGHDALSCDVLTVKHMFSAQTGEMYDSLAPIGEVFRDWHIVIGG